VEFPVLLDACGVFLEYKISKFNPNTVTDQRRSSALYSRFILHRLNSPPIFYLAPSTKGAARGD
jgi:hypothetical protein